MKRLQWLALWDQLREELSKKTSWGRNEIITKMEELERKMIRQLEREDQENDSE